MKQIIRVGLIVLIVLCLVGCLQVNTVVKVKSDGSGTIEETFLMSKVFVQQMKAMMEGMAVKMEQAFKGQKEQNDEQLIKKPKEKQTGKPFDIFNETNLAKKASNLGEGVTYVSGEKITTDKFEGYKAIYEFKDINKLKINQNPSENVPSGPVEKTKGSSKKKEFVTFNFIKGNPSTLNIKLPTDKADIKPKSSSKNIKTTQTNDQTSEMMMAQMKMMFEGMKVAMAIEVQGSIVETNATHREGSRVTLMELDFGKLLEKPENLKKFSQSNVETIESAKKLMKDLPGIKVDLNEEVMIKFK